MHRTSFIALGATLLIVIFSACRHHDPAPGLGPTPARVNSDSATMVGREQRAAMLRDSIARAEAASREAARREAAARLDAERMTLSRPVFFDYDTSELSDQAQATLDAKLPILRAHPGIRIRIEGNTDERGTSEYNLALGQRRAASAKRHLIARGIDESRIEAASLGEERRVCDGEDEACRQRNRRNEFVVIAGAM